MHYQVISNRPTPSTEQGVGEKFHVELHHTTQVHHDSATSVHTITVIVSFIPYLHPAS